MLVKLNDLRAAYVHVFKVDNFDRYSIRLIVPKKHPAVKLLDDAIEAEAKAKWKDKAPAALAKVIKEGNCCFLKAEYTDKDDQVRDGFAGMFSLGAHNKAKPLVLDRDKSPLTEADGRPYAGCYVNATVDVWVQDSTEWGRRVNASLTGVQFVKDGDAFTGGRPADPEDFDDLAEQGGESELEDLTA